MDKLNDYLWTEYDGEDIEIHVEITEDDKKELDDFVDNLKKKSKEQEKNKKSSRKWYADN